MFPSDVQVEIISASLNHGDHIALCGPSGCGKSTALGLLCTALRPDRAKTLFLGGHDVLALWKKGRLDALARIRVASIGFVPQTAGLLPFLNIHENILLGQDIIGRRDKGWVDTLTKRLDIADITLRYPAQISVGQRQRVAIARAMAIRPAIIMADEPTAAVHPTQADEILALLSQEAHKNNAALLITTHDPGRARAHGFHIVECLIDKGTTISSFTITPSRQKSGP